MSKKRAYSDDIRPSSSNSRRSSNGSIAISIDSRSYSIDSRSYSIDSRSYSIDSRSYSIDSTDEMKCGSYDEVKYNKKERKHSNPLLDLFLLKDKKKDSKEAERRRQREMKLYSKSPDEPKTIEQIQKTLYIFKESKK